MDSINFKDFMIKLALSGSVEYFPDKEKEKSTAESKVATKPLKTYNCRHQIESLLNLKKGVTIAELIARLRHNFNIDMVSINDGMGGIYKINADEFWIKLYNWLDNFCTQSANKTEKSANESADCKKYEKYLEKCNRINRDTLKNTCIESLKAEKKCECKNQQDFNKELIKEIGEFRIYLTQATCLLNNIEEKLYTEIKKADTSKLCQCAEKCLTDDEFIEALKMKSKI